MRKYRSTFKQANGDPLPQYVHPMVDRYGVLRTYFRRGDQGGTITGARLQRGVVVLTQGWWDKYFALRHGTPLPTANDEDAVVEPGQVIPRSWEALIGHYTLHSPQWLRMKKRTRQGYGSYLTLISNVLGKIKVDKTPPETVQELIHKKEFGTPGHSKPRPGGARQLRTTFGLLYRHAKTVLKWVKDNPIPDIEKPKSKNKKGWHTWLESEVAAWRLAFADYASDARAVLEMDLAWGARAGDLLDLGWKNIEAEVVSFTPEKTRDSTNVEVHLPVKGDHLFAVLAHRPKDNRFFFQRPPKGMNQYNRDKLVDIRPKHWSYTRLNKEFNEWRATAGLPKRCVLHGLRKLFATRMANAGVSLQDIADALGDTEESAKVYIAMRDKKKGAARGLNAVSEAA